MCHSEDEKRCEACDTGDCPIGGCGNCGEEVSLDRLRKVEIYTFFNQYNQEKLAILRAGENNSELAERYKPSNESAIVTVFDPVAKGGEISFQMALQIESETKRTAVDVKSTIVLYPK